MNPTSPSSLGEILRTEESAILAAWLERQQHAPRGRAERADEKRCLDFVQLLAKALGQAGAVDVTSPAWADVRDWLSDFSEDRARRGFSPSETATFIFSLKHVLFDFLRRAFANDGVRLQDETWRATELLDSLGLLTVDVHQKGREEIILRQQQEMLELSTPVVSLADGILALPLIGTLDSTRTQVVMEGLLQRIVDTAAAIAIIDITGVPMVDTLVAQHLLKTVAAARLMGADCMISGIRPQIAQTIVHLGVELGAVTTKATLADAFALALQRTGRTIARRPDTDGH